MTKKNDNQSKSWQPATKLVRGGLNRSEHGEVSEALFMTQAYAYDSPEQAEQSFTGEVEHYVDRKSTRLNSSHITISYAAFCLKKKNKKSLPY